MRFAVSGSIPLQQRVETTLVVHVERNICVDNKGLHSYSYGAADIFNNITVLCNTPFRLVSVIHAIC